MKHLLNDLSEDVKNHIREQHTGGKQLMIENFDKLVNNKLGTVNTLITEKIGDTLSGQALSSQMAQGVKKEAQFLNAYYKINPPLKSATTGSWTDKDYNDYLKKFMEEKGIPVWICKTGDGYCPDGSDGEVATKDYVKLRDAMGIGPTSTTTDKINTTNDKNYDYKLSNGEYYYSYKRKNSWVKATGKGLESIKKNVKFK